MSENYSHFPSIKSRFGWLLENSFLSDVKFLLGEEEVEIPAHRFLLISASFEFNSLFHQISVDDPIKLPENDPQVFLEFLRYIYTDDIKITTENVVKIFSLAKKFNIKCLKEMCSYKIRDVLRTNENYEECLNSPDFYNIEEIKNEFIELILSSDRNFLDSIKVEYLKFDDLKRVLVSDYSDLTEKDLFEFAMRWASIACAQNGEESTPANMRIELSELFHSIRFPIMSSEEFDECAEKYDGLFSNSEMKELMIFMLKGEGEPYFPLVKRNNYPDFELDFTRLPLIKEENELYGEIQFKDKYELEIKVDEEIRIFGFQILISKRLSYLSKNCFLNVELIESPYQQVLSKGGVVINFDSLETFKGEYLILPHLLTCQGVTLNTNRMYIIRISYNNDTIGHCLPLRKDHLKIGSTTFEFKNSESPILGIAAGKIKEGSSGKKNVFKKLFSKTK